MKAAVLVVLSVDELVVSLALYKVALKDALRAALMAAMLVVMMVLMLLDYLSVVMLVYEMEMKVVHA